MENKLLLNIIEDKYRKFENDYAIVSTDFLDLAQQSISAAFLKAHAQERIFLYGGYAGAERRKIIFVPDYIDASDEDQLADFFVSAPDLCPLAVLDVKILAKGKILRHSDYLGSLLSLGIKREKTGDILTFNDGAQIIVNEEIAAYLAENYTQAGKTPISATVIGIDRLKTSEIKTERIKLSLASPRLDNAVSSVFGISSHLLRSRFRQQRRKQKTGFYTQGR